VVGSAPSAETTGRRGFARCQDRLPSIALGIREARLLVLPWHSGSGPGHVRRLDLLPRTRRRDGQPIHFIASLDRCFRQPIHISQKEGAGDTLTPASSWRSRRTVPANGFFASGSQLGQDLRRSPSTVCPSRLPFRRPVSRDWPELALCARESRVSQEAHSRALPAALSASLFWMVRLSWLLSPTRSRSCRLTQISRRNTNTSTSTAGVQSGHFLFVRAANRGHETVVRGRRRMLLRVFRRPRPMSDECFSPPQPMR